MARLREPGKVVLALGESQIYRTGFRLPDSGQLRRCEAGRIAMSQLSDKRRLPLVTILAESGPLAGDLAACLSGRFDIERVTSPQSALRSLVRGCRALLILGGAQAECEPARIDLVKRAIGARCRVLILGSGGLGLDQDLDAKVIHLPPLPSPDELFRTLAGLEPQLGTGTA